MKNPTLLFFVAAALLPAQRRIIALAVDTQSNPVVRKQFSKAFPEPNTTPDEIVEDYLHAAFSNQEGMRSLNRKGLHLDYRRLLDETMGPRVAKSLHADSLVIVTVTDFGIREEGTGIPCCVGICRSKLTALATIAFSAKLVDVETGITIAATATGLSQDTFHFTRDADGTAAKANAIAGIARNAIAHAAARLAESTAEQIRGLPDGRSPSLPCACNPVGPNPPPPVPIVLSVYGPTLFISGGRESEMKVGDQLAVKRPGTVIFHPITNEPIGRQTEDIEVVTVTEVFDRRAFATSRIDSNARAADTLVPVQ